MLHNCLAKLYILGSLIRQQCMKGTREEQTANSNSEEIITSLWSSWNTPWTQTVAVGKHRIRDVSFALLCLPLHELIIFLTCPGCLATFEECYSSVEEWKELFSRLKKWIYDCLQTVLQLFNKILPIHIFILWIYFQMHKMKSFRLFGKVQNQTKISKLRYFITPEFLLVNITNIY